MATVNDKVQLQSVRTWFDPMDMFRQIAPDGVVKKEAVDKSLSPGEAIDSPSKVELDSAPRPAGTSSELPTRSAEKLAEGAACPFAGTEPAKAKAPFPPTTATEETTRSSEDSEWSKISHPNAPLSAETKEVLGSGEQEGAGQCPFIATAKKQ